MTQSGVTRANACSFAEKCRTAASGRFRRQGARCVRSGARGPAGRRNHGHVHVPPSLGPDTTPYARRGPVRGQLVCSTRGITVPLDPALKAVLDQMATAGGPTMREAGVEQAREMMQLVAMMDGDVVDVARVENLTVAE